MRKFWILGIFGTLCAVSARAADIYVAQTSTGGNTGANCANAQASSSLTATDWSAGNTIHLCGTFSGAAGSNIVTARGSGTSANPITLKFEAGAVLQAPYFSGSSGAINVSGRSYIIIDGGGPCGFTPASGDSSTTNCGVIQNTANGNILTYHQATKGIVISGSSNIEIKNLLIANLYVQATATAASYDATGGGCIYAFSPGSNVSIHHNTMHDGPWCIDMQYSTTSTNLQVYNNNLYNLPHAIVLGGNPGGNMTDVFVHDNHIHDATNWGTTSDAYHITGLHSYGTGSTITNLYWYNNLHDGTWGNSACPGGMNGCLTAFTYIEHDSTGTIANFYAFNNVYIGDIAPNYGLLGVYNAGTTANIYNNTMVTSSASAGSCYYTNASGPVDNWDFRNNLTSNCNNLMNMTLTNLTIATSSPNYNLYATGGGNAFTCAGRTYSFSQFSSWKTCIGSAGDANSSATSSALLNSTTGAPRIGSPVIGAATNLTSLCTGNLVPLCSDILGMARPTSGAWDTGAINYGAVSAGPAPPTALQATVN